MGCGEVSDPEARIAGFSFSFIPAIRFGSPAIYYLKAPAFPESYDKLRYGPEMTMISFLCTGFGHGKVFMKKGASNVLGWTASH